MRSILLGTSIVVILCSGCSTWDKNKSHKKDDSWSITKLWKQEYQEPSTLAVIWSPDTLTIEGQGTSRGFGGRIYFYNERSQAIPVDGDLLVHGYLTTPGQAKGETVEADKKFEFTAEQLSCHFSPSEIGASYSIWVPWDADGGFREEITLIATFKSKNGKLVQGAPAKVFLPGKNREKAELPGFAVQAVSYQSQVIPTNPGPQSESNRSLRTTTIEIPSGAKLNRPNRPTFTLEVASEEGSHSNRATASQPPIGPGNYADTFAVDPQAALDPQVTVSSGVRVGGGQRIEIPVGLGPTQDPATFPSLPAVGNPSPSQTELELRTLPLPPAVRNPMM